MNKIEQIKKLLRETDLTQGQIRELVGCRTQLVTDCVISIGRTFAKDRQRRLYRKSKLGDKNPMQGKCGTDHHNYKGVLDDCKGYKLALKPAWYTGRKGSNHVFLHSLVYCHFSGMTEIPKGYVVHHCDQNPHNNYFSNLIMMTMAEHAALHKFIEGATTISKESTAKWLEARRLRKQCDIV